MRKMPSRLDRPWINHRERHKLNKPVLSSIYLDILDSGKRTETSCYFSYAELMLGVILDIMKHQSSVNGIGSIKGKRVVITGASTGIGEQVAYQYARLGARVLITARREAVLQQVVAKCKELGAQEAFYLPLDMGKQEDTERLIDEAQTRFGGLDHLILNHITTNYMTLWTGDLDNLRKTIDINFHAYVSLATYAMPMLSKSQGSIAVISSVAGKVGVPLVACYSASKFALHGFFDALRQELQMRNTNVSVTTFVIGSIDTPNAIEYSKHVFDSHMFSTTSSSTAYRIMTGTSNHEREVFYPWIQARPMLLLRDVAPGLVELVMKLTMKQEALDKILHEPQIVKT